MSVFLFNLSGKEQKVDTNNSELELKQLLHDIKSPIMAMMAGVDYIQKNEPSSDKAQDALNVLKMATERLNALTDIKKKSNEIFNPLTSIKAIIAEKQFSGFKDIFFVESPVPQDIRLQGSAKIFKTILSNLINNSIEAHASQVRIHINSNADIVKISISDDGCGIPKNKMNFIGKRNTYISDKAGGQGLGLSHAVKTIKEWGGDLLIESQVGMGTTITLLIKKA